MKCEKCGKEYPSKYYFKTETVCNQCYDASTPEEQQLAHQPKLALDPSLLTTTFTLDGYRIAKHLGIVRGITVRSRSLFGTIGGSLQTLVGGNITLFTELCEKTRREAFEMMVEHAKEIGANGVIGIRYDATEVMDGVTEVLCYGTAIVAEAE
jgi:uncharacterized protein YbjQ (UPF0145 family)